MENKLHKFRVSYKVEEHGTTGFRTGEFHYATYAMARRMYKHMVLNYHRSRGIREWEICLNRCSSQTWDHPIFYDRGAGSWRHRKSAAGKRI